MCPDGSSQSIWCWRLGKFLECYWSSVYIVSQKMLVQTSVEECCRNRVDKLARRTEDKKSKAAIPSFISFYLDCHQKAPPSFATCLSTSNDQIKKIPHGSIQQLVFKLNPDSVKLTTKSELPLLNPLVLF